MRVGIIYPQTELGGDPESVRQIGEAAEVLGYRHLLAYDHVLGAQHAGREASMYGPYNERDPFHDPFVMFAYLAGRTTHLGFVTGVLVLPQRQTVLVAKQAADLALLAGVAPDGELRLRLGVGVGWNPVEYQALGQDFHSRGVRIAEQVSLLRRLWTDPLLEFEGRFHTIDRAALVPRPRPSIPLWYGGWVEAARARAAQHGEGFIFAGDPASIEAQWERMRALLKESGRSVTEFGAEAMVTGRSDPADAARFVERWASVGGTHAAICTMGLGLDSITAHLDYFHRAASAVRELLPQSLRERAPQ